jgi:hypothetical protein
MNILTFLMYLGTSYLILDGLWRLVGFGVVTWARMGSINYDKTIYHLLLSIRTMLIGLVTAILTLQAISRNHYGSQTWLICVVAGGAVLFLSNMQMLYSRQAINYGLDKPMEKNYLFILIGIVAYAIFISAPGITTNLVPDRMFNFITWVYSIKYLRNVLTIAGGVFFTWTIYSGVIITAALISILLKRISAQEEP